MLQNKSIPLIDLQKSSNTVALVESFLGEFKHDDECLESVTPDKSNITNTNEHKEEPPIDKPLACKEEHVLVNESQNSLKLENEMKENEVDTDSIPIPVDKPNITTKEITEELVVPVVEQTPLPPTPPPPPVKRKVNPFFKCFLIFIIIILY